MSRRKWEFHPACELFPPMSDAEFQALKEDIKQNGVLQDIIAWKGQLIDGRHRIKACEELGIPWDMAIVEIDEDQDPVAVALSCNMHRRHLSQSQLSLVSDRVRDIYEKQADARMKAGIKPDPVANFPQGKARDAAGKAVGVSGKLTDAARTVREQGIPELYKAVESGKATVTAAAKVATLPKEEQKKAVEDGKIKEKASEIRKAAKESPKPAKKNGPQPDYKLAAKVAADEIIATVKGFLRIKPPVEHLEQVMESIDKASEMVESFAQ